MNSASADDSDCQESQGRVEYHEDHHFYFFIMCGLFFIDFSYV